METIIVELNQRDAEYTKTGEYRVQLAEPIIINEGDQLAFRMASIDTEKTSADTVLITEDLPLSMAFSYYDVDYSRTDKTGVSKTAAWVGDNCGNPTFDYYAAYNDVGIVQLQSITGKILGYQPPFDNNYAEPGGSFIVSTYSTLDPRISFRATYSYLDVSGSLDYVTFTASTVTTVDPPPDWRYTAYGTLSPAETSLPAGQFNLTTLTGAPVASLNLRFKSGSFKLASVSGYWAGKYLNNDGSNTVAYGPGGAFAPQNGGAGTDYDTQFAMTAAQFDTFNVQTTDVETNSRVLDIVNSNAILKAGKYDPASLAVQLTQLFSSANGLVQYVTPPSSVQSLFQPNNQLLTRTDGPLNNEMVFRRLDFSGNVTFTNQNTYKYWDISNNVPIPYFIGASTFALEYGQAGGVFQISYLHTPLTNPARVGEQDLGIFHYYNGAGLQFNVVKAAGGVAIHDLQPQSFWQSTLGIRDKLIVPLLQDASGTQYYEKQSLLNSITEGFHGLGSFLLAPEETTNGYNDPRKVAPIPPTSNPVYIDVTGQSRAIIGETPTENSREGFYLIEVLNFFRRTGGYIDSDENRINISAIASTQYLNANSVTAFADSGIPYIHRGEPYLISEATVRILDPVTKQPATGLGNNTCIFLQVDKMINTSLNLPSETQPPQQDEHAGVEKPK